jgi:hypothetical protein
MLQGKVPPSNARLTRRTSAFNPQLRLLTAAVSGYVVLLLLWGCSGKLREAPSSEPEKDEAIAECVQYETALKTCFHRDTGFASQEALIPKSESDRERLRILCTENLHRLGTGCR